MSKNTQEEEELLYSVKNHVALITLNRPFRSNALTNSLRFSIINAINRAETEEDVRVIILTGAGKNFCAGADLKEHNGEEIPLYHIGLEANDSYRTLIQKIIRAKKIIIAAVNGAAAGAGSGVAMACDLMVMEPDSYILEAFINIALVPDAGASYFLVRQLGYRRALELTIAGKPIPAQQCLEFGLTNKVIKKGELLQEAQKLAEQLAERSVRALSFTKSILRRSENASLSDAIEYEFRLQQFCVGSEDNIESVAAFFEKRKPALRNAPYKIPGGVLLSARL